MSETKNARKNTHVQAEPLMDTNLHESSTTTLRWVTPAQIEGGDLQPRTNFTAIDELAASFRMHGFEPALSHLLVRPLNEVKIEHDEGARFYIKQRPCRVVQSVRGANGSNLEEWQTGDVAETEGSAQQSAERRQRFELICGERRLRAAEEVGLPMVPVVVQEMDDLHVLCLQLVENLQRESLNPMEEARAYLRLEKMGRAREHIAEIVGKSVDHVTQRLLLCRLDNSEVAAAIESGQISGQHGRVLAGVPSAAARLELLQKILSPPDGSPAPWSVKAMAAHVRYHYARDLRDAPFDRDDPDLVLAEYEHGHEREQEFRLWGGACTDCPFAVLPEGAGKGSKAKMCTNPECWKMKEIASHEKWRAQVDGRYAYKTLPHAENVALFNESGVVLDSRRGYVELDELPDETELKPGAGLGDIWENLVKGQHVEVIAVLDRRGEVHQVARHAEAKKAAHLNGHFIFRDSDRERRLDKERSVAAERAPQKSDEQIAEETVQEKQRREKLLQARNADIGAIVAAAEKCVVRGHVNIPSDAWTVMVLALADVLMDSGAISGLLARRFEELPIKDDLHKLIEGWTMAEKVGFVVEAVLWLSIDPDDRGDRKIWAKPFGVRVKAA